MLGPLVAPTGVTWFPAADRAPPSTLVAPEQVVALSLAVTCRREMPPGTYRGALVLQGFGGGGVPVAIEVPAPAKPKPAARKRTAASRAKK